MDATASFVSLIQFTIKGIQTVHKIAISIKEGPDTVVHVAKHASDLLHTMQRLESNLSVGQSLDTRLLDSMEACKTDVTGMAQKLAHAGFRTDDNLGIRLWKSVKSALKEKEWKEFQMKLQHYLNSFTMVIVVEDREKLFDISRRLDLGHESILGILMSVIAKCDGIEAKCAQIEETARIPQLQGVTEAFRKAILGQLQLLVSCDEAHLRQSDTGFDHRTIHESQMTLRQPYVVATNPHTTAAGPNQFSGMGKEAKAQSEPKDALEIERDTALLIDGMRSLFAEATSEEKIRQPIHRQQWKDSGVVLYREIRFTPDIVSHAKSASQKKRQWTLKGVLESSSTIKAFFSMQSVRPISTSSKTARINKRTRDRLKQWSNKGSSSLTLWLKGRYMLERGAENSLTRMGIKLVELAGKSDIPAISYFSQPGRSAEQRALELPEQKAFTSTLYAFVHQTLQLLPAHFEADVDLSEERFRRLDGTKASWGDSVRILNDIIPLLKPTVYCILDGVQWLEHSSTNKDLRLFINVLRQKPMRVLFITTGLSRVLRDTISKEETLADEELGVGRQGEILQRHAQAFWKSEWSL